MKFHNSLVRILWGGLSLILALSFATDSESQEYQTIVEETPELCRDYVQRLSSPAFIEKGAGCYRDLDIESSKVRPVVWEPVTISGNETIYRTIFDFVDSDGVDSRINRGFDGYSLHQINIDIDNDGIPEVVYRAEVGICGSWDVFGIYLIVCDPISGMIDIGKTNTILNITKGRSVNITFDIFIYQGKTYIDMWDHRHSKKASSPLSVFLYRNGKIESPCTFKHVNRKN